MFLGKSGNPKASTGTLAECEHSTRKEQKKLARAERIEEKLLKKNLENTLEKRVENLRKPQNFLEKP